MKNEVFGSKVWDCDALRECEVVGRWRVEDYLAEGGGGAVYRVVNVDDGREGALKIFSGDPENDIHHGADCLVL